MKTYETFPVGTHVKFGLYKGMVVESSPEAVIVQYSTWSYISTWTGEYPRISYKILDLLEVDSE